MSLSCSAALIDAAAGRHVSVDALEPWAELAQLKYSRVAATFHRLQAGDAETRFQVARIRWFSRAL